MSTPHPPLRLSVPLRPPLHAARSGAALPLLPYVPQRGKVDKGQAALQTLQWHDRPLPGPRCKSDPLGRWGMDQPTMIAS